MGKKNRLQLRLSDEERAILDRVSEEMGMSRSEVVRKAVLLYSLVVEGKVSVRGGEENG